MLKKLWRKAEIPLFVAILVLIALAAVAVFIPNYMGRRTLLRIRSSHLVVEGLFIFQAVKVENLRLQAK